MPPEDHIGLAEALLALMEQNEKRGAMSDMARLKALEFQEGPIMDRWMALLGQS